MKFLLTTALVLLAVPALAAPIVYAADAGKHVGQSVTIEGVAKVHIAASGIAFLDIGGD